jgi:hypothetical protein
MNVYYFNHINLPFRQKAYLVSAIIKRVAASSEAVARDHFGQRLIEEKESVSFLGEAVSRGEWYPEYIDRLFWVCCELSLLQYQYPYPHKGQTYKLTRLGRILAARSHSGCLAFVFLAYIVSRTATPIQYFSKVRNFTTVSVGILVWFRQQQFSGFLFGVSLACGIVSTWIASFLTEWGE